MKTATNVSRSGPAERTDQGSVLLEFAFVLPLLTLIFLVIVDLGYAIQEYQVLQNAVREAARFSALPANQIELSPGITEAMIKQRVTDYCTREGMTNLSSRLTITVNQHHPIIIDANQTVEGSQVAVQYSHPLLLGSLSFVPEGQLTLGANAVFRNMY
jgi:Flp pilus assembly protein TadG